jgi:predicted nucleic acid-binding protein
VTGFALDTNVLVYAEGGESSPGEAVKIAVSRRLLGRLAETGGRTVVAVQSLAELHNVLVRKHRRPPSRAAAALRDWLPRAELVGSDATTLAAALDLTVDHNLPIFDALILAAAAEAECDVLLSEDFQDGFRWRGVTVVNPFGLAPDPRVARLL